MTDPRLLVVSEIGAGPPFAGNRARMGTLLDEIRRLGYQIHFAGVEMSKAEQAALAPRIDRWVVNLESWRLVLSRVGLEDRVRFRLKQFGLLRHDSRRDLRSLDSRIDWRWVEHLRALQQRERYVRVLVPYVFHSALLTAFGPECLKILDTQDRFGDRRERLEKAGLMNNWLSLTLSDERIGLLRADRIIAIQDSEQAYFEDLIEGQRSVLTVGHMLQARFVQPDGACAAVIGFFASDNSLNVESLRQFVDACWPSVRAACPEARLVVGGRVCRALGQMPAGIEVVGEVPDSMSFHTHCLFSINPMQGGTGLKIKTVEALAAGRPVVTYAAGADGLDRFVGSGLVLAADAGEFSAACIGLLRDTPGTRSLGESLPSAVTALNDEWRHALRLILER